MFKSGEEAAIKELQKACADIKSSAFEHLRYFVRGDFNLEECGYRNLGHACEAIIKGAMEELDKEEKKFLKKYPD